MWHVKNDEVEPLLRRDVRVALPLGYQLVLYLHPFALFKDASRGPAGVRKRALSYNRAMRWMLLTYIRRWSMIAVVFLLGIASVEAFAAGMAWVTIPAAASAVGCCVAVVVITYTVVAYLLLGMRDD
jgi:hypothetical protein